MIKDIVTESGLNIMTESGNNLIVYIVGVRPSVAVYPKRNPRVVNSPRNP